MPILISCQNCQNLYSTEKVNFKFNIDGTLKTSGYGACPYCNRCTGTIMVELTNMINGVIKIIQSPETNSQELEALSNLLQLNHIETITSEIKKNFPKFQAISDFIEKEHGVKLTIITAIIIALM